MLELLTNFIFQNGNVHVDTLQGKDEAAPELPRAREERGYEEPASVQVRIFSDRTI